MKKHIFLAAVLLLVSCAPKWSHYYSGIVVDELGRTVPSVRVRSGEVGNPSVLTDKNGFFKIVREKPGKKGYILELHLEKPGYISDSLVMEWYMGGKRMFSPILRQDSSSVVLKGHVNRELVLQAQKPMKGQQYDTIIDCKFTKEDLQGAWLKNGTEDLNGLRFNHYGLYVFGVEGNRYISYTIVKDTITLFVKHGQVTKGVIKKLDPQEMQVAWSEGVTTYQKYKPSQ